jgi:hypothetical protein
MAGDEDDDEVTICEERPAEPDTAKLKKAAAAPEEEDGVVLID